MTIPEFVSGIPQDSKPPISKLAVSSFVLGTIALLTCWIPVVNLFMFVLGLISFALGTTAMITIQKQQPKPRGFFFAIVGTIFSLLALFGVIGAQTVYKADIENTLAKLHVTAVGSGTEERADQSVDPSGHISIDTLSAPVPDFEGNPAVILSCTVRERIGDAYLSPHPINARAFQNGKELKRFVLFRYDPEGYDARSAFQGSFDEPRTVTLPFLLDDETSDVRIEIEAEIRNSETQELISTIKLAKTFSLQ
ncbi:DUF5067 domain-containing protein [Corynebacterium sp. HS2168-gen11]|uniref:DUF5067 domain-containing protein n=1 Tax=Corynebacterium sp. HS2168-gen11 TaxID=2974027 RepID=UPI00216AFEE0|nr:DUF5067 domain-containing protein [Corynebacterium sp. HS2168-gen11]MCS4535793.1 DUF5067 domain-containing protein [Corynebacterium sp. HS2168-gen11]